MKKVMKNLFGIISYIILISIASTTTIQAQSNINQEGYLSNNFTSSLSTEIITHKEKPSIIGFAPEDLICFTDNPAPTRNRVSTKSALELVVIAEVKSKGI